MPDLPPDVPIFDADGALSRDYLLHRGHCCKNGCRNCPYGFVTRPDTSTVSGPVNDPSGKGDRPRGRESPG